MKTFLLCVLQMNAPVVVIDGHENVPENDEDALMKAVANQPVSVAIDAGGSDFQFYKEVTFSLKTLLLNQSVLILLIPFQRIFFHIVLRT